MGIRFSAFRAVVMGVWRLHYINEAGFLCNPDESLPYMKRQYEVLEKEKKDDLCNRDIALRVQNSMWEEERESRDEKMEKCRRVVHGSVANVRRGMASFETR